jgi:hypothetical protein
MLHLSRQEIEVIGNGLIADFQKKSAAQPAGIDIEAFAEEYLGLKHIYTKLSDTGDLLGLTTFAGIELMLTRNGRDETMRVEQDTLLVEEALLSDKSTGRRRFTIAHECGHHIIDRMGKELTGNYARARFVSGQAYACREVAKAFDWSEWQANCMAAVLLMPLQVVQYIIDTFRGGEKINYFGWRGFEPDDAKCITAMASCIGVSFTALKIRLGQLGYYEERLADEYRADSAGIICDGSKSAQKVKI